MERLRRLSRPVFPDRRAIEDSMRVELASKAPHSSGPWQRRMPASICTFKTRLLHTRTDALKVEVHHGAISSVPQQIKFMMATRAVTYVEKMK
jgi:hypothetical protein